MPHMPVRQAAVTAVNIISNDQITPWSDNKDALTALRESITMVNDYILGTSCNIDMLSEILAIISATNANERYVYGWRYEEKNQYFATTITNITNRLEQLLGQESDPHKFESLCNVIYYLTVWDCKPSKAIVEKLLQAAYKLFVSGCAIEPKYALSLLSGLDNLDYFPDKQASLEVQNFCKSLVNTALPLLLSTSPEVVDGAPFQLYRQRSTNNSLPKVSGTPQLLPESKALIVDHQANHDSTPHGADQHVRIAKSRRAYVTRLLSKISPLNYKAYHNSISSILMSVHDRKQTRKAIHKLNNDHWFNIFNTLDNEFEISGAGFRIYNLPGSGLQVSYEEPATLEEDTSLELPNDIDLKKHVHKVTYYNHALQVYGYHLQELVEKENYKGFLWCINRYSRCIVSWCHKDSIHRTSFSLSIMDGLFRIIRNHACDISNDIDLIAALKILFKESTMGYNLELFNNRANVFLNILWLNMYLSTALNSELEFTSEEKSKLFSLINNIQPNQTQARALFQIKTMGWNGNTPFTSRLINAMEEHTECFSDSSNPSEIELEIYNKVISRLRTSDRANLVHDHICTLTGQEIDIAYIPAKIAVHIDGPCHFHPTTGSKNMKTIFRDKCLEQSGWHNIDVKIPASLLNSREINLIADNIVKEIKRIKELQKPKATVSHNEPVTRGQPLIFSTTPKVTTSQTGITATRNAKANKITKGNKATIIS